MTTKKRLGRFHLHVLAVLAIGGFWLVGGLTQPAWAAKKKKDKQTGAAAVGASPAILAGSVFTGVGFALPGAEVLISLDGATSSKQSWKAVSDARGEFFVRLPPGPAKYNVSVRARGLKPQEKRISFLADERLEQNFLLEPAAGSGKQ